MLAGPLAAAADPPVRALRDVHHLLSPLVLGDGPYFALLDGGAVPSSPPADADAPDHAPHGRDAEASPAVAVAVTPAVVAAVSCGGAAAADPEFYVAVMAAHAYINAALLSHFKSAGGVRHAATAAGGDGRTGDGGRGGNGGRGGKNETKRKGATTAAREAGATVAPALRCGDGHVALYLRRLGDSCNGLAQRLLVPVRDHSARVDVVRPPVASPSAACAALAERLFRAALTLFDAAGDATNASMVRCNLSSLLRVLAAWEVGRYRHRPRRAGVGTAFEAGAGLVKVQYIPPYFTPSSSNTCLAQFSPPLSAPCLAF